jgi:Tfp pilus assembly protein PilN
MINLLPPDIRSHYRYAHGNVVLLRWLMACGVALIGLILLAGLGIVYTNQTSKSLDSQVTALQSNLEQQNLSKTKAQTENISSSIKLAVTVLSKEVMFSKLLNQLGKITPSNTNLTDLTISQAEQGIDITAQTKNYESATQLQVNLADTGNKLFQKADIVSITCTSNTDGAESFDANYPCTVVVRALFVKNNPYLFINNEGSKP